jgi:phage repressor protein C with HTH and peptisase S24 domain
LATSPANEWCHHAGKTGDEKKMWTTDDPIKNLINERAMERGETWASLSRKLNLNPAYFQQYMRNGKPKHLPERVRYPLARLLDIAESRIRGSFIMKEIERGLHSDGYDAVITPRMPRLIPAYGHATGGLRGEIKLCAENRRDDVVAPPVVANVRNAYALYAVGVLMQPRYFAGEILYVDPGKSIRNGDFVVLQIVNNNRNKNDESCSPLALVRQQINETTFAQLNPPQEMTIGEDQIIARHRIIESGGP